MTETSARIERPGRRRGRAETGAAPSRSAAYRRLHNPFGPLRVFSDDQVESMHQTALRVLEELGMRVLLPQARRIFAAAGAAVDEASQMVRLDRGLVEGAMAKAPPDVELIARDGSRSVVLGGRRMAVVPVAGPPHVTDSDRGKRAGTLADYQEFTKLAQTFDVIHLLGASVEPQDVPIQLRHLDVTLTQAHAEAMAGMVLCQLVRPGAPVVYGSFTSNVDMRSGAPAFGTPEYVKASFGAGQLARRLNLPWRSSNATASNAPDAQAAYESEMSLWGALMGGCNLLIHGAGWLEGGLSASLEKFILDIEMLQMFAELFQPVPFSEDEIAFEDIRQVGPGGHFFAAPHTMNRYQSAFYAPLVSDWRNFGAWSEDGARTATERANRIWKRVLAEFTPPPLDPARADALSDFVARRRAEGGAAPVS